ncbi:MAG: A24 family peptidase [Pseudomonadota bacterium]|nr:prepilin peptidase [Burkholderiales bacterium]MDQ3196636.1 A24 family peptidase [Pseudomonadota bacterium]
MIDALQSLPSLFISVCGLLGLVVGSFINVAIHRVPKMLEREWREQCAELSRSESHGSPGAESAALPPFNLIRPRSRCPACGHTIGALQNIPVLSYVFLRGKCAACKTPISLRYPLIEILTAVLSAFVAFHFGFNVQTLAALFFVWALLVLAFIDIDTQLLPDNITLPLLWSGLLLNLGAVFTDLNSAVIGAAAGYLTLWSVYWLFKLATGKEGMGFGDFKLLAAIGAWFGWQLLPAVILLSSLVGAVIGIGLIVFARHGRNVPIPFGPYLVLAALIALFWGPALNRAYLGI